MNKTREQHIAEFWKSFYAAIEQAGGSINSFGPETTLLEASEKLAQNGIRFVYKKEDIRHNEQIDKWNSLLGR